MDEPETLADYLARTAEHREAQGRRVGALRAALRSFFVPEKAAAAVLALNEYSEALVEVLIEEHEASKAAAERYADSLTFVTKERPPVPL